MRKIRTLIIGMILFTVYGCFGGEDITYEEYIGDTYTLQTISGWRIINKSDLDKDIPKETEVVFLSKDPGMNINIIKEELETDVASISYANANISLSKKNVLGYENIYTEDININNIDTRINVFKGKITASDLLMQYMQIYFVKDRYGYTITATSYPNSTTEDTNALKQVITSFKFKD